MRAAHPPIFSPTTPGPWGVDTIGGDWCVIHRGRLTGKRIGPVIGATTKQRANYFDRAIAEADRRNRQAQTQQQPNTKEG